MVYKKEPKMQRLGDITQRVVHGAFFPLAVALVLLFFPGTVQAGQPQSKETKETAKLRMPEGDGWAFSGNLRFRLESLDGFNAKFYGETKPRPTGSDTILLSRLRLAWKKELTQTVTLSLGIQNSSIHGLDLIDEDFISRNMWNLEHNPYKDYLEPFNTWIGLRSTDGRAEFKLGRQTLGLGDSRCFGPGEFGNSGAWVWDAARITVRGESVTTDLFWGKNVIHVPDILSLGHRHQNEAGGVYVSKKFHGWHLDPFYAFKKDDHPLFKGETGLTAGLDHRYAGIHAASSEPESGKDKGYKKTADTAGGKFPGVAGSGKTGKKLSPIFFALTAVSMSGETGGSEVDAEAFHGLLGYRFTKQRFSPSLSFEYSYASGDADPKDGRLETFDAMFGARDRMYGRMNLMHWKNLEDMQLNLGWNPSKKMKATLSYHRFSMAEAKDAWYLNPSAYRDLTGNGGKDLGREADLILEWKNSRKHSWNVGLCRFWQGGFVDAMMKKQGETPAGATWAFVQFSMGL